MTSTQRKLLAAGAAAGLWAAARLAHRWRQSFRDKVVVITGGSRGLGLVLARRFAAEGAWLALLARDADELHRAERDLARFDVPVVSVACDLRSQEEATNAIGDIVECFGRIDVLVNNAGVIQVGPLDHMSVRDFKDSLAIHVMAPLYTSLASVGFMRRQGEGRIVNISSFGGKVSVPHLLPYCTGKFALVGLSEGLRAELWRDNIKVTTVCPWLMRTGSPPNAYFKGRHRAEYTWFALGGAGPGVSMNARRAAGKIVEACRRGQARLVMGVQGRAITLFNELMPGATSWVMAEINRLLPGPTGRAGDRLHTGWESASSWAPSPLTYFSDRATTRNNELPPRTAEAQLRR